MCRMIIVDDNSRDRNGIKNIIDWGSIGIEVVGVFSNGSQVLEKFDDLMPDLILTDIAMPVMNGIKLAEELKIRQPNIKIIFMSCYNDFDFARSAIDLNIYGYVLKPIIPNELLKAVNKVITTYESENQEKIEKSKMMKQIEESLPMIQEQFFKELLFGVYTDLEDIKKRAEFLQVDVMEEADIRVISIDIKEYENHIKSMPISDKYVINYSIKKIINSFESENCKIFTVQNSNVEFTTIIFNKNFSETEENMKILEQVVEIHNAINTKLKLNVTIGISKTCRKIVDIPILCQQSLSALNTKFYSGGNPIIMFKEIDEKAYSPFEQKVNLETLYNETREILTSVVKETISQFVDKYINIENPNYSENYLKSLAFSLVTILQVNLIESGQSFRDVFEDDIIVWKKLNNFTNLVDLKLWLLNIYITVKEHLDETNNSRDAQIAKDIKQIIAKRFAEQLTVADIAEAIYLSPSHANNIFKREMKKTIFDYLTEYRMEMAKSLLKDPYSRIYLVAEKVGYLNKSHFCLLFKKFTNLTPAEFKNKPTQ